MGYFRRESGCLGDSYSFFLQILAGDCDTESRRRGWSEKAHRSGRVVFGWGRICSWRKVSRRGGIWAMRGWQWRVGKNVRLDVRLCLHGGRLCVGIMGGDGSPHPRGQRGGRAVREPPVRVVNNEGFSSMGQSIFIAITGEGAHKGRPYGGWGRFVSGRADVGREGEGWVPACARTTEGEGMTGEGWVPACARTTGGGWDDGGGMGHVLVFTGAGSAWEQREGKRFSLWNDG